MSNVLTTATYPNQCWHNRTVVDSVVPYEAHDEECDAPVTKVVLVPTYGQIDHAGEYWAELSCTEHLPRLLEDLTSEEGHGYPREELIITTVDKTEEDNHGE